jgi:hemoglobin
MKNLRSIHAEKIVIVSGVIFKHEDIFCVIEEFYNRIQHDQLLQTPFKSVDDWPEHIQKIAHFWWIRFGGKAYLFNQYNPVAKHFFSGFNRELLTRWLLIFHETLKKNLNTEQAQLWTIISEKMGESLFIKNEFFRLEYESRE